MNGSSPRTGVDIEIRIKDVLERTDNIIPPQLSTTVISSLLPITDYSIGVFVVSNVGRSKPFIINATTSFLGKQI